jgi:DNA polymerase I-like protein with 3'-5' exonuclease and polymerase domains
VNLLFQVHPSDRNFLPHLKGLLSNHSVRLNDSTPLTVTEVEIRAKQANCRNVCVTNQRLLARLLGRSDDRKQPTLDDYSGSIIERNGVEYLILNPIEHLITTTTGKFLYERYLSKFTSPSKWLPIPPFSWEVATPARLPDLYADFSSADYISIDIETVEYDLAITCVSYCGIWIDRRTNRFRLHSIVIPFKEEYELAWIHKFNALPIPKIFQNGKYDNAYFLRWGLPVCSWRFDTAHLFHSWYSELPKRLDFIVSFMVRSWEFWKNERNVPIHSYEYYRYNAKDSFTTALSFLCLLKEMPEWALKNFQLEFPLVFPCLLAELTGIKLHEKNFEQLRDRIEERVAARLEDLRASLGEPNFNPNSPPQCVRLWKVLGSSDITSSSAPDRDKVKNRHPLNSFVVDSIEKIRKDRKLLSSYLKDGITLNGRIVYQVNPHGTDTGRLASQESHFWCGLQIHNAPRDTKEISFRSVYAPDNEFELGEADYEQAESRDTANITGDEKYLEAVGGSRDFHSINCAAFFGVPYEKIMDTDGSILDTELRDLSKRVNHGANYNMGWRVLLDTMGIQNVLRARELLKLPKDWTLRQVCEYLLSCFDKSYPVIRGAYHDWIKYQVKTFKLLVGATGWTRYCFGHPAINKQDLNAYVAHPPQSLNAMTLNKAWMKIFYEVYLPNSTDFKLCAQIHDSILFQYRIGREDLIWSVYKCMDFDIPVTDIRGKVRILRVPTAMKAGPGTWNQIQKIKHYELVT